ncbi:Cytochrome c domain-containing protein [uncultured Thiomicrorhabdus sp.]|jgi:cytochrome c553|nr:cytochrome c [Thiomicrorhabdus marina]
MSAKISKNMLALLMMAGVLSLSACSDKEADEQKSAEASTQQMTNAMDVKQPEPSAAPKMPLAEEMPKVAAPEPAAPAPEVKAEQDMQQMVETKAKEAVAAATAGVSGEKVYATCIGCHGAAGEGGVGPKLAGQEVTAIVDKLQRYKAGEQVGPMTGMMAPMASGLSDDDMQAVAEYVNSL